jgi:hypothetical protein
MENVVNRTYRISGILLFSLFLLTQFAFSQVGLSTTSLTFAPQLAGSVSAPQTLTVTNLGNAALTVSSIAASGGYSAKSDCSTLNPGASCNILVTFLSELVGADRGVVTITDNAASSPQLVNLTGSTLPALTLSPARVNLGSAAIGTTGPSKAVTLTNHGPAFSIGAIATSGDYLQSNNCPVTLSSGASCTIKVFFHPTASGAILGALSGTSRDSGSDFPVSAALSGVGVGNVVSHVSLRPASLDFGGKSGFDIFNHSKTVTLTNTSSSTSLTIQDVSVNGPVSFGTPVYQIESTNCKGMLAPGAQCHIRVLVGNSISFPARASGALTIVDSDPTSPQVVGLSATELPEVSFSPATLTFAPQKVGTTSVPQIVTLSSNLDETGISLLPLAVSGDYNVVAAGSNPCGTQPGFSGAGSTCTLGVTFSPNRVGVINGAVTFTLYPECSPEQVIILHQPCPAAQVVNLTGTGQ